MAHVGRDRDRSGDGGRSRETGGPIESVRYIPSVARTPAVQLAPGVWRIPTAPADLVNTFAFVDDDGQVTLVDAGVKRAARRIVSGLEHMGTSPSEVTRIIATHAHSDHVGGLNDIHGRTGARVAVHERDAAYVREGKGPVLDATTAAGRLLRHGRRSTPTQVDEELTDGQVIDVGGGLRVLHTPGHTPGHVALLHEPSGVLITADSIWNIRRRMSWPVKSFCTDFAMTKQTAHVLGEVDYAVAAFTHGPEIRDNAREAIRGFLRDKGGAR
jgi:glyoxylase-like metal-dependent hydrolase (beta-lactamase superfamily II)